LKQKAQGTISTAIVLASFLFYGTSINFGSLSASATPATYGPRSNLEMFYYADDTALWAALKTGTIEMTNWEVTPTQHVDAISDPKILLNTVSRLDFRAWSLNNNLTIAKYPGVTSPMSYVTFRKAIWRLTDTAYYAQVVCGGFAVPLHVPIAAPSYPWYNETVVSYVKTHLSFSIEGAAALLDTAGFTQGATPNPYYNPSVPGSAQFIRRYPQDHPQKPGQDLDGIRFFARTDDVLRFGASTHLRDRMLESGIPVDWSPSDFPPCYSIVMSARNYHIYSAGWSVGRFPTYLYSLFHSSRWFPGGANYHTGELKDYCPPPTPPHYPDIDAAVYEVSYPESYEAARAAAKKAQYYLVEKHAVLIPLWSSKAFYPYRNLLGISNMDSIGPENDYTFLNAYRVDSVSAPIRFGLKSPPLEVNQIYSRWVWDVSTMSPVMAGFMSTPAYDILTDQAWLMQDRELTTWVDPDDGKTKSKVIFWFRDDIEWIKPVTGEVLANFNTQWLEGAGIGRSGYEFNCWYFDSEPAGWIFTSYRDIKLIRTYPSERKAEVYFDALSYWTQYSGYGRILYSSEDLAFPGWKQSPLATVKTTVFVEGTNATTPGYLALPVRTLGTPVEIIEIKEDGVALTPKTDYEIVGSVANGPRIRIYKDIANGKVITAKYWARGDPAGYHPGGLGWEKTLVGCGYYYMTAHTPGAGGSSYYKKNTNFFLQTPPMGEIDYRWYWIESPIKPRDGYFQVDVYDAVLAGGAFESQGYVTPSANWRPGADLATSPTLPTPPFPSPKPPINSAGAIDGYDLGVVGSIFGTTFGSPLPNPPP